MGFAELSITSNFTFLTGGSHPEEYVRRAALLGIEAVAIADVNSVAGIVRGWAEAREIRRQIEERQRLPLIGPPRPDHLPEPARATIFHVPKTLPAACLVLRDGFSLTALPKNRTGWGNLCRMLSAGRLRAQKGECDLQLEDVLKFGDDLALLLHPPQAHQQQCGAGTWRQYAQQLTRRFPCHLLMAPHYDGEDQARFHRLTKLAQDLQIPTVASARPLMHHGARRRLTDVLTCSSKAAKVVIQRTQNNVCASIV